ncbi:MAG: flagellar export chaperone FlgN [Armatimonadota bacterium]|nr:flagellar export chaperone FlgN [Armatimonadota bacterium]
MKGQMNVESIRKQLASLAEIRTLGLKRLVDLAGEQRAILIEGRLDELSDNVQAQEQVLAEIARAQKREAELSSSLQDETDQKTGSDSLRKLDGADREASGALELLRPLVRGNTELLDNQMRYVTFSLAILSSLASDQQSYNPGPEPVVNHQAVMLDMKV